MASPQHSSENTSFVSSAGQDAQAGTKTNNGGKVKQTRRRQRLSCVECTKRRQKCDRQFPCGLCTTRGIPHLCHWEPHIARPAPQRPPHVSSSGTNATVEALSARIAALEEILQKKEQASNGTEPSPRPSSTSSETSANSPETDSARRVLELAAAAHIPDVPRYVDSDNIGEQGPRALIDYNVQVAAVALAQLSLAPRTEFVGNGTVLCAIHKLGDPESWRFPYPATSLTSPVPPKNRATSSEFPAEDRGHNPNVHSPTWSPGRRLVQHIPPRPQVDELVSAFFTERNWQFGISERWFRSGLQQMWSHLDLRCDSSCPIAGGCPACKEEINPHWLSLLFAVLALVPCPANTPENRAAYFMYALTARRFMDDTLLSSPAYSTSEGAVDGGVLSCIAATFLAMYLVERGRVSEAWKLVGSGVRAAQALGMHRDPSWGKWEAMHKVERELRVTGWWLLVIYDRLWSWILGRPPMVHKDTYDVVAKINEKHADGSPNPAAAYVSAMIELSGIIGEAALKCHGPFTPPYARILETDSRFQDWEMQLPDELHWQRELDQSPSPDIFDPAAVAARALAYQRHGLAAWYYGGLMNLHRPYVMHYPPILPPPGTAVDTRRMLNPSRDRCIEVAITMTRVLCSFHDKMEDLPGLCKVDTGTFAFFIFDGAVACAGALSQTPPRPKKDQCLALMDRAISVLTRKADVSKNATDGQGEVAKRGIVVLKALKRAAGWDMSDDEKGELVLLQDMLKQQRARPTEQSTEARNPAAKLADAYSPPGERNAQARYSNGPTISPSVSPPSFAPESKSTSPLSPSIFIPYLSSTSTDATTTSAYPAQTLGGPTQAFAYSSPNSLSDQIFNNPNSSWAGLGTPSRPPTQSMVMPFEALQGVQPTAQEVSELDLNWIRLAGMDSWFASQSS